MIAGFEKNSFQTDEEYKKYILPVVITAFILRLAWAIIYRDLPVISDASIYHSTAINIAEFNGIVWPGTDTPTAHYSPGYPLFLSFFYYFIGPYKFVAFLLNAVLSTIMVFLVYKLGCRLISARFGIIAAILLALFPSQIFWSATLLSEPLFGVLGLSCLYFGFRGEWKYTILSGLLFGAFLMVRSQGILIFPAILLIFFDKSNTKSFITKTCIFIIAAGILLFPWLYRNHQVFGKWLLTNNMGVNFYMGVFPGADGTYVGPSELNKYVTIPPGTSEYDKDKIYLRASYDAILNDVPGYLSLIPRKLFVFLRSDLAPLEMSQVITADKLWEVLSWLRGKSPRPEGVSDFTLFCVFITQLYYLAVFFIAFFSAVIYFRQEKKVILLSIAVILFFILFHVLYVAPERYHFFIIPFLVILAGIGVEKKVYGRKIRLNES